MSVHEQPVALLDVGRRLLVGSADEGDDVADGDCAARRGVDRPDHARALDLVLEGGLVGDDLAQAIAGLDGVADLDQPAAHGGLIEVLGPLRAPRGDRHRGAPAG